MRLTSSPMKLLLTMKFLLIVLVTSLLVTPAVARPPFDFDDFEIPILLPDQPHPPPAKGLQSLTDEQWGRQEVTRILQAFAFGGQATDQQVNQWASMHPGDAIDEMLTFSPVNLQLSPQGRDDPSTQYCNSLEKLQEFWSSDDPKNPMRVANRSWYKTLDDEDEYVAPVHLFLTWSRLAHTPGCNGFVTKLALYITNYHASIHFQNSGSTLIRSYYDDVVKGITEGADFVDLMTLAASHAALARAYGHMENVFDEQGAFQGNDDFAREYFQLLFGIKGVSEDEDYHENVTIEHNAWLLTGMALDAVPDAWGSTRRTDWLVAPLVFTNHFDAAGRLIPNQATHYMGRGGEPSCLEILHENICGKNAMEKLVALGRVAGAHPESMANTPVKIVSFFADDKLTEEKIAQLQYSWSEANFDLLKFLRAYAISTAFHSPDTFKLHSAFERNLLIHNANQLNAEEAYAELFTEGPTIRMFEQGALVFAPIRDVFGGQTGTDAANDRYVFKNAWDANVMAPEFLGKPSEPYRLVANGRVHEWRKDWGSVIPENKLGEHIVAEVGGWLWDRFLNDSKLNYDVVAQAQVHALLATGFDFGAVANENNMEAVYSSAEISTGDLAELNNALAETVMDFSTEDANVRVGMAINFITALPYTFASGGLTAGGQ